MKSKSLLAWRSPLSGAICGLLVQGFILVVLLPPVLWVFYLSRQLTAWGNLPWVSNRAAMLILAPIAAGGAALCGVYYFRLLRKAYDRIPAVIAESWSFLAAVFILPAPWLLLLPAALRRRNGTAAAWALGAGLCYAALPFFGFVRVRPAWSALFLLLLLAGLLLQMVAMAAALPEERLQKRCRVLAAAFLLFLGGVEASALVFRHASRQILASLGNLQQAAEADDGESAPVPAVFVALRARAMESGGMLSELYRLTGSLLTLPTPAERQAFEALVRAHADTLALADALTDLPPGDGRYAWEERIGDDYGDDLRIFRNLGRYYAVRLQLAALDGDRDGVRDASRRLERLRDLAEDESIRGAISVFSLESIRREVFFPVLPLPVLTDEDLVRLSNSFEDSARLLRSRLTRSLAGEVRMMRNMWNFYCFPARYATEQRQESQRIPPLLDFYTGGNSLLRLWARIDIRQGLSFYRDFRQILQDRRISGQERRQEWQSLSERYPRHLFVSRHFLPSPDLDFHYNVLLDNIGAAKLAVAVERYRRKHGRLPDSLERLKPEFVAELPLSRTTHQPFQYEQGEIRLRDWGGFRSRGEREEEGATRPGFRIHLPLRAGQDPDGRPHRTRIRCTVFTPEAKEPGNEP